MPTNTETIETSKGPQDQQLPETSVENPQSTSDDKGKVASKEKIDLDEFIKDFNKSADKRAQKYLRIYNEAKAMGPDEIDVPIVDIALSQSLAYPLHDKLHEYAMEACFASMAHPDRNAKDYRSYALCAREELPRLLYECAVPVDRA